MKSLQSVPWCTARGLCQALIAHTRSCAAQTPALLPFPDLTQPELAYPMYPQPEVDAELIARIDDVYLRNLDMPELIEKARIAVIGHAAKLLKADPARTIDYIVLDMPCTFFMLRSLRYVLPPSCHHLAAPPVVPCNIRHAVSVSTSCVSRTSGEACGSGLPLEPPLMSCQHTGSIQTLLALYCIVLRRPYKSAAASCCSCNASSTLQHTTQQPCQAEC